MKRTLATFGILVIFAALLAGCTNDQYAIEKQFWYAQKQADTIFANPHATPPNELQRVIGVLGRFAQRYPETPLSLEAEFTIARLCLATKEYDAGRKQLQRIMEKYSKNTAICSEAVFLYGNSYELQDKWPLALEQYQKIIHEYQFTPRGISMPMYIAEHYKVKFEPEKMRQALQDAISHYQTLAIRFPNSQLSFTAHTLIAQCYMGLQDWQNAIGALDTVINRYRTKAPVDEFIVNKAVIYSRELNDKATAKEILQQFIKDYPRSGLIATAKQLLKKLE
ncbi:MAG TPA: tetratricopeptide repeat protein [Patescibacteria group bacterium]|nr:tetratricopeptide repeat protein [Patescibacteria group bacterium]